MKFINNNISTDTILNGRVIIKQFQQGYRVGIDAVLLASMVTENTANTQVLDLGAGVGSVSLCLLSRLDKLRVTSIEKELAYYQLSLENKVINNFAGERYNPLLGEISKFTDLFNTFNIVVSNPPYFKKTEVRTSSSELKTVAHTESTASLVDFVHVSYKYLKPKGTVFIILKTQRLLEILNHIDLKRWGEITLYPIYSYANSIADRLIISMKKNSREASKITPGIVIHNSDSSYTNDALAILAHAKGYFDR